LLYSSLILQSRLTFLISSFIPKDLDKSGKGAVIGSLYLRRKYTGGKLVILQVIRDTLAALTLPGAWLIGAGAVGFVNLNLTFHIVVFSYR